jgi:hypothetical protein
MFEPDIEPIRLADLGPKDITVRGVTYRLSPLDLRDTQELEAWVLTQVPDLIAIARRLAEGQEPEVKKEILLEAFEVARSGYGHLGTPEATRVLKTFLGMREQVYLAGRKHHPQLSREDWGEILARCVEDDLREIERRLQEENGGAIPDPKGPSSSTPTGGPPTGARSSTSSPASAAGTPGASSSSP